MGISSQTKTWNLVYNLHFTEKCGAGLYSPWSMWMKCRNSWHSISQFLVLIVWGLGCSVPWNRCSCCSCPQNVENGEKCCCTTFCILCNNFNLQLGTILWFHQKHVAWSLATIARIQWCFTLHPSSLSEQIKLWHSMFNFTRGEPQPIRGPAPAQLSSLPGRYQYCRDEECQ